MPRLSPLAALILLAVAGCTPLPQGAVRTYGQPPPVVTAPAVAAPVAPVMHIVPNGAGGRGGSTPMLAHPGAIVTPPVVIPPPPPPPPVSLAAPVRD
jgi:hypothetical protein